MSYISAFKQWFSYCTSIREDPFNLPCNGELAAFFIAERVEALGSIGSIKNWTAMLNWIHELANEKTFYKSNTIYINYLKALKIQFPKKSDPRLPFTIFHILNYTKYYNINLLTLKSVPLKNLIKVLYAQLQFFIMNRPCELVNSKYSETKNGIKMWQVHRDNKNDMSYFYIKILYHKTMSTSSEYKYFYITDTRCEKVKSGKSANCMCFYLNPYRLLCEYLNRRYNNPNIHKNLKLNKQSVNKKLLIWDNGKIISTTDLTLITKEIKMINKIPERDLDRLTNYSYRIGGTTRAVSMGIHHISLLKFVGWSDSFLTDSSASYIRPDTNTLIRIPYQMIHGINNNANQSFYQNENQGLVFDPWTKVYSRNSNKFCY